MSRKLSPRRHGRTGRYCKPFPQLLFLLPARVGTDETNNDAGDPAKIKSDSLRICSLLSEGCLGEPRGGKQGTGPSLQPRGSLGFPKVTLVTCDYVHVNLKYQLQLSTWLLSHTSHISRARQSLNFKADGLPPLPASSLKMPLQLVWDRVQDFFYSLVSAVCSRGWKHESKPSLSNPVAVHQLLGEFFMPSEFQAPCHPH